ncbi:hypothetical protein J7E97_01225 [Streptomyces sp. ISL-66]|uniref:hypothetical protein n=1 Tax=Streptomyces sp. ISL-66 TaxID=2819186 RepID=UPI001BE7280C|nr:hypothetical protein [Streptomyces sp. ISL-66]MBT2466518.1 hypothetical protein [Streptomyces sp. ISL-66]
MRLRTTAAALLAALALVLPTAGQSLANDHDDRDGLGELLYRYNDGDDTRHGRLEPADNDTCYQLTHASRNHPAFAVHNETESLAVLFENRSCGGQAEEVLEPGESAHDLEVRSVLFKPTDEHHHGRHDGRDDDRRDDDRRDDEDRSHSGRSAVAQGNERARDLFDSVFRSIG